MLASRLSPFIRVVRLARASLAKSWKSHHRKHHQTYVTNFNAAREQYAEAETKKDHAKMLSLQSAIKFNGGGHVNHSIFWTNLAPSNQGGGGEPEGKLRKALDLEFGSFDAFKKTMAAKSVARLGARNWGWLGFSPESSAWVSVRLPIKIRASRRAMCRCWALMCGNTRTICSTRMCVRTTSMPFWDVVNWKNVEERYLAAEEGCWCKLHARSVLDASEDGTVF
ncbi:unnamed protein product [Peronospora destructor]|uniref:Superoxide dismutase n=1 Tax=Peronospora destructor TaxID=86335 RepID=A0AAV0VE83_9STRA|nr:unnamed protein product [Peronospora destructor]